MGLGPLRMLAGNAGPPKEVPPEGRQGPFSPIFQRQGAKQWDLSEGSEGRNGTLGCSQ